ncbi:MAG: hypothetical protein Q9183_002588, partial [Haloplaca sp. 2 TL-2023]
MPGSRLCDTCAGQLLSLYRFGFCTRPSSLFPRRRILSHKNFAIPERQSFTTRQALRQFSNSVKDETDPQQIAHTVTKTRQTFGDTLPEGFLSNEEYKVYERLYGPPAGVTRPQDVGLLQDLRPIEDEIPVPEQNTLLRQDEDGNLEEIGVVARSEQDPGESGEQGGSVGEEELENNGELGENEEVLTHGFDERFASYREEVAASGAMSEPRTVEASEDLDEEMDEVVEEEGEADMEEEDADAVEAEENAYSNDDGPRRHPLTVAGKWGTSPSTIQLPNDTFVNPVSAIFSKASNKHLSEAALKTFGGRGLPNSTATPTPKSVGENLKQSPIALEASQSNM